MGIRLATVSSRIPSLQHSTAQLFIFIRALFDNISIRKAYIFATGATTSKNAFRWLNKLKSNLIDYRQFLGFRSETLNTTFGTRVHRLQILLPTLQRLPVTTNTNPCQHYQFLQQSSFI